MRKATRLMFLIFCSYFSSGQISVIGHNHLNGNSLANTKICVKENGVVTQTLNTGTKADFLIKLPYGKNYSVYLQNPKCPVMYFEVFATNIPTDKYTFRMPFELLVPFCHKTDEDIDTSVFKNAFCKLLFDGRSQIISDTAYSADFSKKLLKKEKTPTKITNKSWKIFAGKLKSEENINLNSLRLAFYLPSGEKLKTSQINRLGMFQFKMENTSTVANISIETSDSSLKNKTFQLLNTRGDIISAFKLQPLQTKLQLSKAQSDTLVDNAVSNQIGGKLVVSSKKEKRFFADKTVYLLNKMHTVLQKTTTNIIGTFVFSDIKPNVSYYIAVSKNELNAHERIDILNKDDKYICSLDTSSGDKYSKSIISDDNNTFNELLIADNELKMSVNATIFGDNVNNPIGKLKIILLNDEYEAIDSVLTDDFGAFKFKYLPFLKRFFLDADNSDNILDVFKNILIYSSEDNLVKIMTHQKGKKFSYDPVSAEIIRLRELEIEDSWLKLIDEPETDPLLAGLMGNHLIVENILFENNKYELSNQSKEILNKIILVLNSRKLVMIEIGAHTDNKGSELENLLLSQNRAKSVHAYIVSAGIEEKRVVSKGYGETKPLIMCSVKRPCTEAEHAKNRRIEFKIIDNNQSPK